MHIKSTILASHTQSIDRGRHVIPEYYFLNYPIFTSWGRTSTIGTAQRAMDIDIATDLGIVLKSESEASDFEIKRSVIGITDYRVIGYTLHCTNFQKNINTTL